MQSLGTPQTLSLTGEVAETFERDGVEIAKLSFRSIQLEVPISLLDTAHLGDTVQLEATIVIHTIQPNIGFEESDMFPYFDPDIYP